MKFFNTSLVLVIVLLTSCNKDVNLNDPINPNDPNLVVIEEGVDGDIYKIFHSYKHKKDYEDLISGVLTTEDVLKKYGIDDLGLSTKEWTGIISGKINPVDFDNRIQLKKAEGNNITFTQMLSEKVRGVAMPAAPETLEINTEDYFVNTSTARTSIARTSIISFVGSDLYFFDVEYHLWFDSQSRTKIRDRSYQPIYIDHSSSNDNNSSTSLFNFTVEMKHQWFHNGPTWNIVKPANNNPWTWGQEQRVEFKLNAWFKFFYTQTYITVGVY